MTFDTVHIVRRYGAWRLFSTDQLNPNRKKRLFYGLPPYSTVRFGAFFFVFDNPTVRCGAFFVFYGAVRLNRTAPHRTVKSLAIFPCVIEASSVEHSASYEVGGCWLLTAAFVSAASTPHPGAFEAGGALSEQPLSIMKHSFEVDVLT